MNLGLPTIALGMGLLGSTHCVAMCGGVSSMLATGPRRTIGVAFQLGRVSAYTALGGLSAMLGLIPHQLAFVPFVLRVVAALCMLTVGLHLAGLPSSVKLIESAGAPIWRRVAPLAKRFLPLRSHGQAYLAGGLWAFMPCGLLYGAVALAASATSPLTGALTMLAFGAGTLPAMIGLGLVAQKMSTVFAKLWVRRVAGAVVLAFGLWTTTGLAREALGATPSHCSVHH